MPVNYLKRDFPSAQVFFYKFGKVFKMNLNEYAVNNELLKFLKLKQNTYTFEILANP